MQKYNISNTALKMIKKDDEEEKKNNETTKNEDMSDKSFNEVLLDLDDIKNKYSSKDYVDAPDELKLDKINVPNKTEDELLSIAKSSLDKKYTSNKEATNSSFENKINNLLKKQNDYKTNAESSKKIINETYDEAINNYGSDKPDLRFEMKINEVSDISKNTTFTVFSNVCCVCILSMVGFGRKFFCTK